MKKFKIYIAGKINPNSVFGRHDWRDAFCAKLSMLSGFDFENLDPTKSDKNFQLDQGNGMLIIGRCCFMIKLADIVVVNLTDDISIGGSQEMFIAKYFNKPLIGIAPKGGKFVREKKEILGNIYTDWMNPFVTVSCDMVFEDIDGVAQYIKTNISTTSTPKNIGILDKALSYYQKNHLDNDKFVSDINR